jgi:AcrR family transcriptional regulator
LLSQGGDCHNVQVAQSLRERKKERTREALVAAGMRLLADRGFDAVTVADIAAEADVAPRTFHRYFPDKAELLFSADTELLETVRAALDRQPPGAAPVDLLRAVLAAVCEPLAGRHDELVARNRLLKEVPAVRDRDLAKRAALEELMAGHLAKRLGVEVDQDVRPRWWAGVGYATFTAGYQSWLGQGGDLAAHIASAAQLLPGARPEAKRA